MAADRNRGGGEAADRGAKRRKRPEGARTYAEANEGRRGRTAKPGEGAAEQPPRRGASHAVAPAPRSGAQSTRPKGCTSQPKNLTNPRKSPKPTHQKKKNQ